MSSQAIDFEVAPIRKPNGSEALAVTTPNPFALFQQALAQGITLEQMQVFQGMCERWEANEARKAFVVAMNRFKANPPQIEKNKHVKFGQTEYDHATLDHVCKVLTKSLGEYGVTHRWKVDQADGAIRVTCILTHELGHSEETTLQGPADNSGSKNAIQQIASTVTYLQRYTLLAATGMAAGVADNDGASLQAGGLTDERFVALQDGIAGSNTHDELKAVYQAACKEADAANDQTAKRDFNQTKNKRYKELVNAGR